ncbi:hypothetical protein ACN28C_05665 [Plantactinospora sp. WMMC1484]|uniref:hypothetical protein n=1 Tax=Plantactinospora sp. WMMC1484 TaxID=3404122 RepID=UPI003BF47376
MSERAERLLREAVHELAGNPHQSPDLVATALVQGRRMRRRRQAVAAAAAAVAVGAIAAPYVWLRPGPEPPPLPIGAVPTATASPAPSPNRSDGWRDGPVALPGGALVLSVASSVRNEPTWVYDPTRRHFVSIPAEYTGVRAAPHGMVAAVRHSGRPAEVGLYQIRTGDVRWFPTGNKVLATEWSSDGGRLLITLLDERTGAYSIGLLTATEGPLQRYQVKAFPLTCGTACRFSWLPSGKEVTLDGPDPGTTPSTVAGLTLRGLQLFSADDGIPTRTLGVEGEVAGVSAWSPDGSLVVVAGGAPGLPGGAPTPRAPVRTDRAGGDAPTRAGTTPPARLVHVETGKVLREMPTAQVSWIGRDRLLYLDDKVRPGRLTAILVDTKGTEIERTELPAGLTGDDEIVVAAS